MTAPYNPTRRYDEDDEEVMPVSLAGSPPNNYGQAGGVANPNYRPLPTNANVPKKAQQMWENSPLGQPTIAGTTPWTPTSATDYRAEASTARESTGDLFDPTQDPSTRRDAIANNGFNLANIWSRWNQLTNREMNEVEEADARRMQTRAEADAVIANRPVARAEPTVADWVDPSGDRPALTTDDEMLGLYQRLAAETGLGDDWENGYGHVTATADQVGGGGAAFQNYAQGANNMFMRSFNDQIGKMQESAAARGRLNTGYFDQDTGELGIRMGQDYNDQMLMKALDAARLDQDAAVGNADRKLKADLGILTENRLRGDAGVGSKLDLLDFAAGRGDTRDKARQGAYEWDADFGRQNYEDTRDFEEDRYRDRTATDWDQYEGDREFYENRRRYDEGEASNADAFYADMVASTRDWRYGQMARQDEEKANSGFSGAFKNYILPTANVAAKFFKPGA